ncbi:MAG: GAF domain-containing protein [Anaerolineae bacterium]|nr:GAF domain-containing protein [Anaerolineae bacterium]
MESPIRPTRKEAGYVVEDWPMNLEATRSELKKAQQRLERYQAALRLADVEIKRRNRSIIALTTFAYQASHTANPTDLLKMALVQGLETTSAPVGAILLIDAETKELTLGVHKGLNTELIRILTGQELGQGATALMPHLVAGVGALLEYDTSDDDAERLLLSTSHLTSLVSLSLQIGPRLIGALLVGLKAKRHFTPAELCFLMALSQETAVAMESLRLREGLWITAEALLGGSAGVELQEVEQTELDIDVPTPLGLPDITSAIPQPAEDDLEQLLAAMMEAEDEVQQQNADLQTLNNISEMINCTLNLKEILQCTVSQTQTTLKTDAAWLYLIDERDQLEMQAHTGLSTEYVRGMQCLPMGKGIEGRTAVQNKAHFIESVLKDTHGHKIWVDKEKLQALAAVPITRPDSNAPSHAGQTNSNVIGVLATGKRSQNYLWTPREMRLLSSIANQVAPAIDNARLYAQVQEGEVGLRTGNEILQEINDMLLEKNAHLEGFVQNDLSPALTMAAQVLHHLLAQNPETLSDEQKKDITILQKIVYRLNDLARETNLISATLNSEFDKVLDTEDKIHNYASSVRPIRLEKRTAKDALSTDSEKEKDVASTEKDDPDAKLVTSPQNSEVDPKPMTFEDAVAAGLVPGHILNREKK